MKDDESITDKALMDSTVIQETLGDAYERLELFYQKLSREGELRGIIGPRDTEIIWERHILNSAAVVPFISTAVVHSQFKTVADIGSGGGFPGIVAASCLPDCQFTLIEPMERRCIWLEECVEAMQLQNAEIVRARAEEVIQQINEQHTRHPFAAVTCRAVAPMRKLIPWTLPLLKSHGILLAIKGRSAQIELDKAAKQIREFHGTHPRVELAAVAKGLEPTHVAIVERQ